MEQGIDIEDKLYIRGFNSGYMLAKHEPDMAAKIAAHKNPHSHYFVGFVDGKQEYDKEAREWAKNLAKGRNTSGGKPLDKNK